MQALVTGVAGFIGSHLAEALLQAGHRVRGVDAFTSYYDTGYKRANLSGLLSWPGFELAAVDLRSAELSPLLADSDVVFHLAGQPGVRLSWSDGFAAYSPHRCSAASFVTPYGLCGRGRSVSSVG